MHQVRLLTLVVAAGMTLAACPGGGAPDVGGTVTNTAGEPVEGAQILISGREFATTVTATSGADGSWSAQLSVPDANYLAAAWLPTVYEGHQYELPLEPVGDTDLTFHGSEGFRRDFQLRTSGRAFFGETMQPDDPAGFYGGAIDVFVYDSSHDFSGTEAMQLPAGTQITVTLTPVAPLIDGGEGEIVERTVTIEEATGPNTIESVATITDVPLGHYTASATLGGEALGVASMCGAVGCPSTQPPLAPTADVLWPPRGLDHPSPYQGHPVAKVELYLHD